MRHRIGVIGLGIMGRRMLTNLSTHGGTMPSFRDGLSVRTAIEKILAS